MKCPYCGTDDTRVIDSRPADDNTAIRRRRLCEHCGKRFTTYETLETMPVMVVKRDETREPYDRSKVEAGIVRSCHKRPVSAARISRAVDEIENEIFASGRTEVSSREIGDMVLKHLRKLDQVAYVRFASVYREFRDVNTFVEEIRRLQAEQQEETEDKED